MVIGFLDVERLGNLGKRIALFELDGHTSSVRQNILSSLKMINAGIAPLKSKLSLPFFAAIVLENIPPIRTSLVARGQCQLSDAWFHLMISVGCVQRSHTSAQEARIVTKNVTLPVIATSNRLDLRLLAPTRQSRPWC